MMMEALYTTAILSLIVLVTGTTIYIIEYFERKHYEEYLRRKRQRKEEEIWKR